MQNTVDALGLKMFTEAELTPVIDRVLLANKQSVDNLGKNAFGMLMGAVMKEVRGKANPELVGKLLQGTPKITPFYSLKTALSRKS